MPQHPVRLGQPPDFIDLQLLEHGAPATPSEGDVRLGVSVRMDDFTGRYDQAWIAKADWSSFLSALDRLERDRRGQASVVSMAPEEFALSLRIVDAAGHLVAVGHLSRYHFGRPDGNAARSRIEYHTSVDAGLLRRLADEFSSFGDDVAE
jgi:hypothetical protein